LVLHVTLNEQNQKKITRLAKVVDNNTDIFEKEIDNLTSKIEIMLKETLKAPKASKRKRSDEDDVAKVAKARAGAGVGAGAGTSDVKSSKKEKKKTANEIRDEYISRLINDRKKSKPWTIGMSKYGSITYMEGSLKKWLWQSVIFDEPNQNFETKEEAESYFEQF